jgi:hypothetical protein
MMMETIARCQPAGGYVDRVLGAFVITMGAGAAVLGQQLCLTLSGAYGSIALRKREEVV